MRHTLKLDFYLRFYTHPGESILLVGNLPELGSGQPDAAIPLDYVNGDFWHGSILLAARPADPIHYHYVLRNADGTLTEEWGDDKFIDTQAVTAAEIQVIDAWNFTGEFENIFFTSPFRDVLLPGHKAVRKARSKETPTCIFRVKAPLLEESEVICLLGNSTGLNDWNEEDPLLLAPLGDWWTIALPLAPESFPLEYKYGVYHKKEKKLTRYELGPNRYVPGDARPDKVSIFHDGFVRLPNNTNWHGAGVSIPVFSLRSRDSMGVGEFTDLEELVDWAVKCRLKLIQLLPVYDTSANHNWMDSYPYAAISAFALHPIYLNLEKCAGKKNAGLIKPLNKKKKELNALPELDYAQVMKIKLLTIKELYELQKEEFEKEAGYLEFFEQNKPWLVPYAAFCYLRDKHGTPDFSKWTIHNQYDEKAIQNYVSPGKPHYDSIALQYFIQYHLHIQLRDAVDYAHEQGIVVKGDIPIGIGRYSCDAWENPKLYHMDLQAGAPPDDFAVKGQNWSFPTYNWEEMAKDGFTWWKLRFGQMQKYFDGFRIDHILGFFRIWSIPMDVVEGILGHFAPAIPVHQIEFLQRNIWFDRDRYTRPFINEGVLWELFAQDSDHVKQQYLDHQGNGFYSLKEAYNTQRKIEAVFGQIQSSPFNEKIRQGLYDLLSNVILLEAAGSDGQQFHFRISMEQTSSFRYLEWHTQQQLKDLYVNYFYRRQDDFWQHEAMKKLPALKRATNMLVFGEDLGMVPRSVPDVMRQLGILSLEVQRMPKNTSRQFARPAEAPYLSVVTPSTHDMSTIRGWWEEDRAVTQRFFNEELGQWGEAPPFCEPWINKAIVLQHLHSPAQWAIFQLQDLMGMSEQFRRENPHDERINVPANPHHYWRYRMHLTLEELLDEKLFNNDLRKEIAASGR
jgi:4-alpha-glucanotransferase